MADYKKPDQTIPRIGGANHYRSFLDACKGGEPATSNFDYAGPFTEMVLFGNIAMRMNKPLEYDMANMKVLNDADAAKFLTKEYRAGWELPV